MKLSYVLLPNDDFHTVRNVLKSHFKVSTRLLLKLKKLGLVCLNNSPCRLDDKVTIGDCVSFSLGYEEDNSNIVATKMDLNIIYEDDCFIVLDKPPFMAIHPTSYHFDDTLSNGLKYYYDTIGLKKKIRPINRLDRNTSGLVVFAKNEYIQEMLIHQMACGLFVKKYLGIVDGKLSTKSGSIDAPISRKEGSIIERRIDSTGFRAITHYSVIAEFVNYSEVEFILETGRTHQIRVHCKHIGHPLLGDTLYGTASELIDRQALHSHYISFVHPITLEQMELTCELPLDMKALVEQI